MSKYYIPKLSEFHIGFRFEQNEDYKLDNWDFWEESFNKNLCKFKEGESLWSKSTFGKQDKENGRIGFYGMLSQTPMGTGRSAFNEMENFRVKYLDQKDIEELGWVRLEGDDRSEHIAFKWPNLDALNLYFAEDGEVVITDLLTKQGFANDSTSFHGKVKNYNELFKLMQMLGI